ncbi:MAG TPA: tetratricopeptide repeat protein [Candidatus Dormibacteraeota bacterium]
MKTDPGDSLKTRAQYADEAIQLAIAGRWDEAVSLNKEILDKFGSDEDANNRLGKALTELGRLAEAKKAYNATLAVNQFNVIARKNVVKLDTLLSAKADLKGGPVKVDLNLFVEEMGKTQTTQLEDVSDPNVCDLVVAGDIVELRIEGPAVIAETVRGIRLGVLESKLARRLIKFIQGGNRYQAAVTACDSSLVRIIIRETYQDAKFAGKPSFPMKRTRAGSEYRPYAKESLIPRNRSFSDDDEDEDGESGRDGGDEEFEGMSMEGESDSGGDDEGGDVDFSEDEGEAMEIEDDESDDGDDDS